MTDNFTPPILPKSVSTNSPNDHQKKDEDAVVVSTPKEDPNLPSNQQEENAVVEQARSEVAQLKIKLEEVISQKEKINRESAGSLMDVNMENVRLDEENKGMKKLLSQAFSRIMALQDDLKKKQFEAEKEIKDLKQELTHLRKKNAEMEQKSKERPEIFTNKKIELKKTKDNLKSALQERDQVRKKLEETRVEKDEACEIIKTQREVICDLEENEKEIRKQLEASKKQSEEISGLKKAVHDQALRILQLVEHEKVEEIEIEKKMSELVTRIEELEKSVGDHHLHISKLVTKQLEQAEKKGAEQSREMSELRARVQELEKTASVKNAWAQSLKQQSTFMAKQIEGIQESLKHLANF